MYRRVTTWPEDGLTTRYSNTYHHSCCPGTRTDESGCLCTKPAHKDPHQRAGTVGHSFCDPHGPPRVRLLHAEIALGERHHRRANCGEEHATRCQYNSCDKAVASATHGAPVDGLLAGCAGAAASPAAQTSQAVIRGPAEDIRAGKWDAGWPQDLRSGHHPRRPASSHGWSSPQRTSRRHCSPTLSNFSTINTDPESARRALHARAMSLPSTFSRAVSSLGSSTSHGGLYA